MTQEKDLEDMQLRLDKYLCDLSLGSRSQVKEFIKKGRIKVNGEMIKKPEYKVDTASDRVTYDGRELTFEEFAYYMLYKPAGVLSAAPDKKQPTVLDLIDSSHKDLFPVGRLDKDTTGLLLISNDGPLAHRLLSPAHHVDKCYEVKLDLPVSEADIHLLETGVDIGDDSLTRPAGLTLLDESKKHLTITIQEGRFHQIKRMFAACGKEVIFLKRLSMGPLTLDPSLEAGTYRKLTAEEIKALKEV